MRTPVPIAATRTWCADREIMPPPESLRMERPAYDGRQTSSREAAGVLPASAHGHVARQRSHAHGEHTRLGHQRARSADERQVGPRNVEPQLARRASAQIDANKMT